MCTYCRRVYTNLNDVRQCEKECLDEISKTWDLLCPSCGEDEQVEMGICLTPKGERLAHYRCEKCSTTFGPAKDAGFSLEKFEPGKAVMVLKES